MYTIMVPFLSEVYAGYTNCINMNIVHILWRNNVTYKMQNYRRVWSYIHPKDANSYQPSAI